LQRAIRFLAIRPLCRRVPIAVRGWRPLRSSRQIAQSSALAETTHGPQTIAADMRLWHGDGPLVGVPDCGRHRAGAIRQVRARTPTLAWRSETTGRPHPAANSTDFTEQLSHDLNSVYDQYLASKTTIQNDYNIQFSMPVSVFGQWGTPNGGSGVAELVYSPTVTWTPFTNTAIGSGAFNFAFQQNQFWTPANTNSQQGSMGLITAPNDWGGNGYQFAQITWTQTLPGKWLAVSAGAVLPHDRCSRFKPNADAAALVDISALGGNSTDDILGGQYRCHVAATLRGRLPSQAIVGVNRFSTASLQFTRVMSEIDIWRAANLDAQALRRESVRGEQHARRRARGRRRSRWRVDVAPDYRRRRAARHESRRRGIARAGH
jgi:hypothetical protein